MKIYLIRHGLAYEPEAPDYEDDTQRPLTDKGGDKMNRVARVLRKMEIKPDVIVSSPYLRALQTAKIVAKELKYKRSKLELSEALLPAAQPEAIIREIIEKYMVEELVMVGHAPSLGLLISALTAGGPGLAIDMKYGSACCLSANDLQSEQRATLEWLLTPRAATRI